MELQVQITGTAEVRRRIAELAKLYPKALAAALYQEGFRLWADATKRAPVEFGVLRGSAYAAPPTERGGQTVVEVGFGTDYAIKQHEGRFEHPRGGESKYLANALQALSAGFLSRLATQTERNAKSGTESVSLGAPSRPMVRSSSGRRGERRRRATRRRR